MEERMLFAAVTLGANSLMQLTATPRSACYYARDKLYPIVRFA